MHSLGVGNDLGVDEEKCVGVHVCACVCVYAVGRQSDGGGEVWEGRFAGGSGQSWG